MDRGDDDVGQVLGLETSGLGVDGLDRVADRQVGNAGRGDQRGQVLGDGADHADTHPTLREDGAGPEIVGDGRGALLVDVGSQVWEIPVDAFVDVLGEIGQSLVELVVSHRRGLQAGVLEDVDRRVVVLGTGLECRSTDVVAGRGEQDVVGPLVGAGLLHGGEEFGSLTDTTVEVVEAEDGDVGVRGAGRRGAAGLGRAGRGAGRRGGVLAG